MFATFEDIAFDGEGEIDGYQFDGRERRMNFDVQQFIIFWW